MMRESLPVAPVQRFVRRRRLAMTTSRFRFLLRPRSDSQNTKNTFLRDGWHDGKFRRFVCGDGNIAVRCSKTRKFVGASFVRSWWHVEMEIAVFVRYSVEGSSRVLNDDLYLWNWHPRSVEDPSVKPRRRLLCQNHSRTKSQSNKQ